MTERYKLAKAKGLNWQVLLIQDTETDLKMLILDGVRKSETFGAIDSKVTKLINERVNELESDGLKVITRASLYKYASKLWLDFTAIFGDKRDGETALILLLASGINAPQELKTAYLSLPEQNPLKRQFSAQSVMQAQEQSQVQLYAQEQGGAEYVIDSGSAYNRATANNVYDKDYGKAVIERLNKLFDSVAKTDYSEYSSLRASAERQVRWEYQEEQKRKLIESGERFVWIDSHANCSERCQDFQGRLYSLDGTSGTHDGNPFVPLETATDIYTTTKAGKTYKNGCISGFNCRHKLLKYRKGFKPTPIPARIVEKERAIEQRMREMERTIRLYESRALGYKTIGNKGMRARYKDLADKWTERYVAFANKNNVAYYPSRIDI